MEPVTFPRQGSDYTPLPQSKTHGRVVSHAVQTINASPEEVFRVYSRPELLPSWQEGVVSVTSTGENTLHWVVADPATGRQLEFDSEILEAIPGKLHVSRIVNGPFATTVATMTFEPHPSGRGTVTTMISDYKVPGGAIANAIAAVASRSPEQMTIENLRHLKQLIESGEIPSVEGQPAGPRGVTGKWKRFLLGENMPPPPGTSDRARPQDEPHHDAQPGALALGGLALAAAGAAWYIVSKVRD